MKANLTHLAGLGVLLVGAILYSLSAKAETEGFPESVNIIGQGIQNSATQEVLLLSCVGQAIEEVSGINCDSVRFVRFPKTRTPSWLGQAFDAKNVYQIAATLTDFYKMSFGNGFLGLYRGKKLGAFTQRNGWNWGDSSVEVSGDEYLRIEMTAAFYAALRNSDDSNQALSFKRDYEVGDRVIVGDQVDREFRVVELNQNQTYALSDGKNYSRSQLARPVDSVGEWKTGMNVYVPRPEVANGLKIGTLSRLSPNGKAWVKFKYESKIYGLDQLIEVKAIEQKRPVYTDFLTAIRHDYLDYTLVGYVHSKESVVLSDDFNESYFLVPEKEVKEKLLSFQGFKAGDAIRVTGTFPGVTDSEKNWGFSVNGFIEINGEKRVILDSTYTMSRLFDVSKTLSVNEIVHADLHSF